MWVLITAIAGGFLLGVVAAWLYFQLKVGDGLYGEGSGAARMPTRPVIPMSNALQLAEIERCAAGMQPLLENIALDFNIEPLLAYLNAHHGRVQSEAYRESFARIAKAEPAGLETLRAVVQALAARWPAERDGLPTCRQATRELGRLYLQALAALPPFVRAMHEFEASFNKAYCKAHGAAGARQTQTGGSGAPVRVRCADLKPLCRIIECGCLRPGPSSERRHGPGIDCDIVRCRVECDSCATMAAAANAIALGARPRFRIAHVQDSVSAPAFLSWREVVLYVAAPGDCTGHLCEIRLVLRAMMRQRGALGGDRAYAKARAAGEMLGRHRVALDTQPRRPAARSAGGGGGEDQQRAARFTCARELPQLAPWLMRLAAVEHSCCAAAAYGHGYGGRLVARYVPAGRQRACAELLTRSRAQALGSVRLDAASVRLARAVRAGIG
eukprot:g6426.t1